VRRIASGFLLAQIIGVPTGLFMAIHRASFETAFTNRRNLTVDTSGRLDSDLVKTYADYMLEFKLIRALPNYATFLSPKLNGEIANV
jgi:hypothetical protein